MKKLPETITEEELIEIIKNVNHNHHKLAFLLGFYEGMRISEITSLEPGNVDKGQKLLRIKQAKGSKDRNIPIAPEVLSGLKYLPIKCGIRALQMAFKKYSKKVLDRDLHFHCLRHSSATHYLSKKKWNIRQVQQVLGHASLDSTMIYTHV